MDTNVKELKQGASKIADLLQRKPQEEVLETKPSTASSDEEKLAAGISTIGLQAKSSKMDENCGRHGDEGNLANIFYWKTGKKESIQKTCVNVGV
jgi:hypothetical protein